MGEKISDRGTRDQALAAAVSIEVSATHVDGTYNADVVVNMAKKFEKYLLGEVETDGR